MCPAIVCYTKMQCIARIMFEHVISYELFVFRFQSNCVAKGKIDNKARKVKYGVVDGRNRTTQKLDAIDLSSDDERCIVQPVHDDSSQSLSDSYSDMGDNNDEDNLTIKVNGRLRKYPFRSLELERIKQVRIMKDEQLVCEMKFKPIDKSVFVPIKVAHKNYSVDLIKYYEQILVFAEGTNY